MDASVHGDHVQQSAGPARRLLGAVGKLTVLQSGKTPQSHLLKPSKSGAPPLQGPPIAQELQATVQVARSVTPTELQASPLSWSPRTGAASRAMQAM